VESRVSQIHSSAVLRLRAAMGVHAAKSERKRSPQLARGLPAEA
jgi:hypothetical protein